MDVKYCLDSSTSTVMLNLQVSVDLFHFSGKEVHDILSMRNKHHFLCL